jgi:putative cell wall-binding protein
MTGALWRERYDPLEVVAEHDGTSLVRGYDNVHQRAVALKVRATPTAADRADAVREASTLLSLQPHPGLPTVRDDFAQDGTYVIVLDWVAGTSLQEVLDRRGNPGMPPATVVPWLRDLAAAIDHLHRHAPPIVHGDVKPANAILTAAGHVVLVDLGSAAARDGGTAGYRAPEAAAGPGPAADVYGLAATAYALLAGGPPTTGPPADDRIDPTAVNIIERALRPGLAVDPSRRPATATELVERVAAWATPEPPATAPPAAALPRRRDRHRRWWPPVVAAVVVTAAVIASILATGSSPSTPTGERRLQGADRYATAAAVATAAFPRAAAVVIVRADEAPDALAALYLAGAEHAPLLFSGPSGLSDATARAITRLRPRQAFIIGDDSAVPAGVEARLAQLHVTAVRLAAPNRYGTAAVVAQAGGPPASLAGLGPTAVVIDDTDAAASTGVGALAYGAHYPVLYAAADGIPPETGAALSEDHIGHVLLVGAAGALASQLQRLGLTAQVVSPATGPAASIAAAGFETDTLGWTGADVVLARGDTFSDAVAAGQLAGSDRAPLLLTQSPVELGEPTAGYLRSRAPLGRLDLVGDPTAIAASTFRAAATAGRCCVSGPPASR